MSLSRRQFFRRFLGSTGEDPSPGRIARYQDLETYVRTQLFPYDFALTPEQESELMTEVRRIFERAPNDALHSPSITAEIQENVDMMIRQWREQSTGQLQPERATEVRHAAPDYVATFFTLHEGSEYIRQLQTNYGTDDLEELQTLLRNQIQQSVDELSDRLILQYDVVSVQDLVFAQLRSWC